MKSQPRQGSSLHNASFCSPVMIIKHTFLFDSQKFLPMANPIYLICENIAQNKVALSHREIKIVPYFALLSTADTLDAEGR